MDYDINVIRNYTVPIIIDSFYASGGEHVSLPFEK